MCRFGGGHRATRAWPRCSWFAGLQNWRSLESPQKLSNCGPADCGDVLVPRMNGCPLVGSLSGDLRQGETCWRRSLRAHCGVGKPFLVCRAQQKPGALDVSCGSQSCLLQRFPVRIDLLSTLCSDCAGLTHVSSALPVCGSRISHLDRKSVV